MACVLAGAMLARMKTTNRCTKCEGEDLWKVDPICTYDPTTANSVYPLPVACRMIENRDPGLFEHHSKRTEVGKLIAYVCGTCGFTELYAADIEKLAALRKGGDGSKVSRLKKKEGSGSPFRG